MGYNTTLMILNDNWHNIKKDPQAWVDSIDRVMNSGGDARFQTAVMKTEHADIMRVYVTQGNSITELSPYNKEVIELAAKTSWYKDYLLNLIINVKRQILSFQKDIKDL